MKNLFIISLVILTLFSCSNSSSDDKTKQENSLIGKWKLIEQKNSDGSATVPSWTTVINSYDLTLNENLTFTSTQITGCTNGTYMIENGKITLTYECGNGTIPNQFTILSNSNTELIIKNVNCIEECADKFLKTN